MEPDEKRLVRIKKIRKRLLETNPFIGSVAMTMEVVISDRHHGIAVPTAVTDGDYIVFNPVFVDELNDADLNKVVVHETMHKALGHPYRMGSLISKYPIDTIQEAGDYAVHAELSKDGFDIYITSDIGVTLYDPMFDNWSLERIVEYLNRNNGGVPETQESTVYIISDDGDQQITCAGGGGGGEEEEKDQADGQVQEAADGEGNEGEQRDDSSPDKSDNDGSNDADQDAKPRKKRIGSFREPTNPTGKKLDQQAIEEKNQEFQQQLVSIDFITSKMSGPGDTNITGKRDLNKYIKPPKDWRRVLEAFIAKVGDKSGTTNTRLNRQLMKVGIHYPDDIYDGMGWLVIASDVSSSVDNHLQEQFFNHIEKIIKSSNIKHVSIVPFSDHIHQEAIQEIYEGTGFKRQISGYGATRFSPVFHWIKRKIKDKDYKENEWPDACIIFTDLGSNDYGDMPGYPVMWASSVPIYQYSNGFSNKPPFGVTLEIF